MIFLHALSGLPARAADAVLYSDHVELTPGAAFEIAVTFVNATTAPREIQVPTQLQVRIETSGTVTTLELQRSSPEAAVDGTVTLDAAGARTARFAGTLPAGLSGTVTLTAPGLEANPLLLHVAPAAAPAVSPGRPRDEDKSPAASVTPPPALSFYGPNYFLVGGDGGLNAKFQLGFKFRLFDDRGPLARRLPWLHDLYFGYSQVSLWDLHEDSSPFHDSSYRPSLFFGNYDLARSGSGRWHFGLEDGVGHESNGKDGPDSRSLNFVFVRPTLLYGDVDGQRFFFAPLVYAYFDKSENPDILHYRGYVDWAFGYGSKGGWNAWATFRRGTRDFSSVEMNVSYPLSRLGAGNLSGWMLLQYFNGYGESLLDYNRRLPSQWRLGIALAL